MLTCVNTMKDVINSIRLQISERLNSPLFGSFVISWVAWNHRLLAVLFSGLPVNEKFTLIDTKLYPDNWTIWKTSAILPFSTAVLFILLYPVISKFFYAYWLRRNNELKQLRDNIENATLLTREESHALRMAMIKIKDEYEETINRQSMEIETLKRNAVQKPSEEAALKQRELEQSVAHLTTKLQQMIDREKQADSPEGAKEQEASDAGTLRIIELLVKNGGSMDRSIIFDTLKEPKVRVQYYLDEVIRMGFAETGRRVFAGSSIPLITLSAKGRKFAVERGLT